MESSAEYLMKMLLRRLCVYVCLWREIAMALSQGKFTIMMTNIVML
jgi:hypothetical protein